MPNTRTPKRRKFTLKKMNLSRKKNQASLERHLGKLISRAEAMHIQLTRKYKLSNVDIETGEFGVRFNKRKGTEFTTPNAKEVISRFSDTNVEIVLSLIEDRRYHLDVAIPDTQSRIQGIKRRRLHTIGKLDELRKKKPK
jgi:hypothetical protein